MLALKFVLDIYAHTVELEIRENVVFKGCSVAS
jgi:hypothetical protein